MTEEKAKTKWCPMVRHINDVKVPVACNRDALNGVQPYNSCIASECMMWIWDEKCTPETETLLAKPGHGHCGLTK